MTGVLLDTHVALWAITDDARLTSRARELIMAESAEIFIRSSSPLIGLVR